MEILFGLIAITVVLVGGVSVVFLWAVRSGQFDDLDSPAVAILSDADEIAQHGDNAGTHSGAEAAARETEPAHDTEINR